MRAAITTIIGILIILSVAYYFLIFRPARLKRKGTETSGSGNNSTPTPYDPPINVGENAFLRTDVGNPAGDTYSGIPVYRQPIADGPGTYLEGVSRPDWLGGNAIGRVVEKKNGWIKANLNNYQIWKYYVSLTTIPAGTNVNNVNIPFPIQVKGYSGVIGKLTGDYWFKESHLKTINF